MYLSLSLCLSGNDDFMICIFPIYLFFSLLYMCVIPILWSGVVLLLFTFEIPSSGTGIGVAWSVFRQKTSACLQKSLRFFASCSARHLGALGLSICLLHLFIWCEMVGRLREKTPTDTLLRTSDALVNEPMRKLMTISSSVILIMNE